IAARIRRKRDQRWWKQEAARVGHISFFAQNTELSQLLAIPRLGKFAIEVKKLTIILLHCNNQMHHFPTQHEKNNYFKELWICSALSWLHKNRLLWHISVHGEIGSLNTSRRQHIQKKGKHYTGGIEETCNMYITGGTEKHIPGGNIVLVM
ncbi:hypothetical protein ACJX0J_041737, partial [Zea mays]